MFVILGNALYAFVDTSFKTKNRASKDRGQPIKYLINE